MSHKIAAYVSCLFAALLMSAGTNSCANAQSTGSISIFPHRHPPQNDKYLFHATVVDKKDSKLWACSAAYMFSTQAWLGDCTRVDKTSALQIFPNTEIASVMEENPTGIPHLWFIEPTSGQVHICALTVSNEKCFAFPLPLP